MDTNKNNHYLIVANGVAGDLKSLEEQSKGRNIILLDGAANIFKAIKYKPSAIIGDLDSLDDKSYWEKQDVPIIHIEDQDTTDLEKALLLCQKYKAEDVIILHATGGRMDHQLYNLRLLKKYYNIKCRLRILTESQVIEYIKDADLTVFGEKGDICGIMAFPKGRITTKGLKYEVEDYLLDFAVSEGCSNLFINNKVAISVKGEVLVTYPLV